MIHENYEPSEYVDFGEYVEPLYSGLDNYT